MFSPFDIPWHTDEGNPLWVGPSASTERQMAQAQAETTFRRYLTANANCSSITLHPLHAGCAFAGAQTIMSLGRAGVAFAKHDGCNMVDGPKELLMHLDDQGNVKDPVLLCSKAKALVQRSNGEMDHLGILWVTGDEQRFPIIPVERKKEGDKEQNRDITFVINDPSQRPSHKPDGSLGLPVSWLDGEPQALTSIEQKTLIGLDGQWTNGKGAFDLALLLNELGEAKIVLTMSKKPHRLFDGSAFTCKKHPGAKICLDFPKNTIPEGGVSVKAAQNSMGGNDTNSGQGADTESMVTLSQGCVGILNALPVVGNDRRKRKGEEADENKSERLSTTLAYLINTCKSERLGAEKHHQDLPVAVMIGGWMVPLDNGIALPQVAFKDTLLQRLALISLLQAQLDEVRDGTPTADEIKSVLAGMIERLLTKVPSAELTRWNTLRFVGVGACTPQIEPPLTYTEIERWKARASQGPSSLGETILAEAGVNPPHRMATGPFIIDNAQTPKKRAEDEKTQATIEKLMPGHSVSHMVKRVVENMLKQSKSLI